MIVTILDIILLLLAIGKYLNRKYTIPIVVFAFFVTDGFIISFGGVTPVIKHLDFAFIQMIITSFIMRMKYSNFFSLKNDVVGKIIAIYLFFFLLEFIRTVVLNYDTLSYALADIRLWFIPFSYFMFRRIDLISFKQAGKYIIGFTLFSSLLFVLQYITHLPLINTFIGSEKVYRMHITPAFIEIIVLFLLFSKEKIRYRYCYISLLVLVLFLSQNRTPIITLVILSLLNIVLYNKSKKGIIVLIFLVIAYPFFNTLMEKRADGQTSINDSRAIEMITDMDYKNLQNESTFFFRIAIILERVEYLFSHPDKLLLGVGCIHEDSPKNRFNFITGTRRPNSMNRMQLSSIDIMWCSPVIQFGILGVGLLIFVMISCCMMFYRSRKDMIMMVGFLVFLGFFIQSFSSNSLRFSYNLFFMAILMAYNRTLNNYKKYTDNDSYIK